MSCDSVEVCGPESGRAAEVHFSCLAELVDKCNNVPFHSPHNVWFIQNAPASPINLQIEATVSTPFKLVCEVFLGSKSLEI